MLQRDEGEHPVPAAIRPLIKNIVDALATGDLLLAGLETAGVEAVRPPTAKQIAGAIEGYGDPLAPLNDAIWERSIYNWAGGERWDFLIDLTTSREAVSDLALLLQVSGEPRAITVNSVHVP
ncbi:MAG: hypothetical protein EON87_18085 [Brevundimonas sp.]|nr:MAG: hypothetical protein EON87_18085 [Brevundimonas sp.]